LKQTKAKQVTETGHQTDTKAAAKEAFLPVMRELARAYQAFADYSLKHVRELNLTPPQFDVIATLGNTSGMSMGELAERTLVTKGTLTGIIDRLEQKGLVRREVPLGNRRSFTIVLTPEGERTFESVFPAHIAYLKERFGRLSPQEIEEVRAALKKLRELF
jgi:DNA-binding MarR family transcriptional regulator